MVRWTPYAAVVRLIGLAQDRWEEIDGQAAWEGRPSLWERPLREWCAVVYWWHSRHLSAEGRAEFRTLIYQSDPTLRLYTVAGRRSQRRQVKVDNSFVDAMKAMGSVRR